MIEPLKWKNGCLEIIDQTLLPGRLEYAVCRNHKDVIEAIKTMKVRGAPLIGITAVFGVYLGLKGKKWGSRKDLHRESDLLIADIASARPTANDLFYALDKVKSEIRKRPDTAPGVLPDLVLSLALRLVEEDLDRSRRIGSNGDVLIKEGMRLLTHCNAGGLATAGGGTALSVIYHCRKKIEKVYVDETRPCLQGARLTVWELLRSKIPCTLICDNAAGTFMKQKKIDAVIVGADRIAANGDTANKIGTYQLAVLASYHGIPFYVAAPLSTFDPDIKSGEQIPVEERHPDEVRVIMGKKVTVPSVDAANPAFDVTPSELITAVITEKGVIASPVGSNIRAFLDAYRH
jgi:methylthioribose-1-phosphate isomerase